MIVKTEDEDLIKALICSGWIRFRADEFYWPTEWMAQA